MNTHYLSKQDATAEITATIEAGGAAKSSEYNVDAIFDDCYAPAGAPTYGYVQRADTEEFWASVERHALTIVTVEDPTKAEAEEVPVFDIRTYRRAYVTDDGRHYPAYDEYVEIAQTMDGDYLQRGWTGETGTPGGWSWVEDDQDSQAEVRLIVSCIGWAQA
jgi:hypothetical protein